MDGGGPDVTRAPLRFHDVCARFGITPRTLRHYEALEILTADRGGPDRVYDARQQVRLELALRGRRLRLRLEDIRQILNIYDTDGPAAQAARWHAELRRQRRALAAERDELSAILSEIDEVLPRPARRHA
ncbi:MerR family DNA-binding protein [Roseivivax sp. CAU 1761]